VVRAVILLIVLASAAAAGAAWPSMHLNDQVLRADALEDRLAAANARLEEMDGAAAAQAGTVVGLRTRVARLQDRLAAAREAKVRTVVEERVVTEKVLRWIPDGEAVSVEMTGFQGMVGIHDVQITQSYGFSDLVGIAVNKSGATVSYAQLGCTFLDAEGRVLANAMANKQGWKPGQTWGFTCSAQVDATGGILRVDEMS
jgi:uncharacterized coiled-coil protein SlyX